MYRVQLQESMPIKEMMYVLHISGKIKTTGTPTPYKCIIVQLQKRPQINYCDTRKDLL